MLGDHLEVITRMLAGDRHDHATFEGEYATVRDAINVPKPIQQPRVPIMVGGNGPNVTWRLAARHADELNVDGMLPAELGEAMPTIRARCEEIGRDPATLAISVHVWGGHVKRAGQERVDRFAAYRELGVDRIMTLRRDSATTDEALESLAADARAAGAELA
jgi:alkanesulfonate monooxygenase SsuD/methylene tetrahydromethanopterin reductase-like flavin-dependent oxidoreductase (luciferase family)